MLQYCHMDRILEYRVEPHDIAATSGGLLGKILNNCMGLTSHEISHVKFTPGGITILREGSAGPLPTPVTVKSKVQPGDLIRVLFADPVEEAAEKVPPVKGELAILYEDEDVIVLNKPAGLVSHPSHGHHRDTLANFLAGYYEGKGMGGRLRVVGRLDKDTSGVILFAKSAMAAARLFKQKDKGECRKTYLAVTEGTGLHEAGADNFNKNAICGESAALEGTDRSVSREDDRNAGWQEISLPLGPVPWSLAKQQVLAPPAGKPALTRYVCLGEKEGYSLIKAEIETGRTHQIRVHMAAIGHPLMGDPLYGTPSEHAARALLHASQLIFLQPFSGKEIRVTAPLPEDMKLYF